jgi:hypothetical protein
MTYNQQPNLAVGGGGGQPGKLNDQGQAPGVIDPTQQ